MKVNVPVLLSIEVDTLDEALILKFVQDQATKLLVPATMELAFGVQTDADVLKIWGVTAIQVQIDIENTSMQAIS